MEVINDLPEDRSQENINKVLDSTQKIVDQVLSRLMTQYNDKSLTFNNQESRLDFTIQDNFTALPLIDDTESNHTGWQVTFTITEQVRYSTCCNTDVFDA